MRDIITVSGASDPDANPEPERAMTTTVKLIDQSTLPQTYAEIRKQFTGAGLRKAVWEAAKRGGVGHLARQIGLTAGGRAGLDAVEAVLVAEWRAAGFDRVCVGEADPSVYGAGQVAAYLDQPAAY